jgi:hypothetical protein
MHRNSRSQDCGEEYIVDNSRVDRTNPTGSCAPELRLSLVFTSSYTTKHPNGATRAEVWSAMHARSVYSTVSTEEHVH